jgi:hypothetical protein
MKMTPSLVTINCGILRYAYTVDARLERTENDQRLEHVIDVSTALDVA